MLYKYELKNNIKIKYEGTDGFKHGMFEIKADYDIIGFIINRYYLMNWLERLLNDMNIIEEYFSISIKNIKCKSYYNLVYRYTDLFIYLKFTWIMTCYKVMMLKIKKGNKFYGFTIDIYTCNPFHKIYNCNYPKIKKYARKIKSFDKIGKENRRIKSISKFVYNIYKNSPKYDDISLFISDEKIKIPFKEYF